MPIPSENRRLVQGGRESHFEYIPWAVHWKGNRVGCTGRARYSAGVSHFAVRKRARSPRGGAKPRWYRGISPVLCISRGRGFCFPLNTRGSRSDGSSTLEFLRISHCPS